MTGTATAGINEDFHGRTHRTIAHASGQAWTEEDYLNSREGFLCHVPTRRTAF